jgi:hypothetical protein
MAQNINLLTLADGFGDSRAVPSWYPDYIKWPEIIKLMTRGVTLHNLSRYGAGNEYILHCLRNNLIDKQAVIIQWAIPNRLDLTLSHNSEYTDFWAKKIASDPIYNNNILSCGNDSIWISSASTVPEVREYHTKFIGLRQHQLRSQFYIDYAILLLKEIPYGFMLTKTSSYLNETIYDHSNWFWNQPFQGMCEFRHDSKYAELELNITQPLPLVQFDFIRRCIQPRFNLPWRSEREIHAVENMLYRKYQDALKNKPA